MTGFKGLPQFPLQGVFTVPVPARSRDSGPAAARDRAVVPLLLQEAPRLAAVALLGL